MQCRWHNLCRHQDISTKLRCRCIAHNTVHTTRRMDEHFSWSWWIHIQLYSGMNMACDSQHPTMQMYHSHLLVFGMQELRKILIQINICTACISYAITIHEYVMTDDDKYFNKYTHFTPLWRILPGLDARFLRWKCTSPQSTHSCSIDDMVERKVLVVRSESCIHIYYF